MYLKEFCWDRVIIKFLSHLIAIRLTPLLWLLYHNILPISNQNLFLGKNIHIRFLWLFSYTKWSFHLPLQTSSLSDHSAFSAIGIEQPLTEEDLKNMHIAVLSANPEELVFDISGVDLAIVNALRRILIAEVWINSLFRWLVSWYFQYTKYANRFQLSALNLSILETIRQSFQMKY